MSEDLLEVIKSIISNTEDLKSKIDVDEINLEHSFVQDLGFDSLSLMTLAYELQEIYPNLNEASIVNWNNVSDCLLDIKKLIK